MFSVLRLIKYSCCCAVLRSLVSLRMDCMDCSPPGSSVQGIFQAGILQWVTISYSGDLPDPKIGPRSLCLLRW